MYQGLRCTEIAHGPCGLLCDIGELIIRGHCLRGESLYLLGGVQRAALCKIRRVFLAGHT